MEQNCICNYYSIINKPSNYKPMSYVSFQEMKPRVGIDDVAFSLGYKLNRQAGVGRYIELILPDGRGEKLAETSGRSSAR